MVMPQRPYRGFLRRRQSSKFLDTNISSFGVFERWQAQSSPLFLDLRVFVSLKMNINYVLPLLFAVNIPIHVFTYT